MGNNILKRIGRIAVIAMVFVLIAGLSSTAFAAPYNAGDNENYMESQLSDDPALVSALVSSATTAPSSFPKLSSSAYAAAYPLSASAKGPVYKSSALSTMGTSSSLISPATTHTTGDYTVTASSGLNVRQSPSTSAKVLTAIPNNKKITITKVSGEWGQTTYNKHTGWVYLLYTKKVVKYSTGSYKVTASSGLNLRQSANDKSAILTAIPYNKTITVSKVSENWGFTRYNNKDGYVCLDYCKFVTGSAASAGAGAAAQGSATSSKSLNVPSFKQTDSRWASTYIGNKTIGQIGCLVTSLSMIYSYKHGTKTYPNAMMKKLSFKNNDLVWSSAISCKAISTTKSCSSLSQAVLNEIFSQLKAGKPVLIGAKNSTNGMHWVVITGYSGSTSNFSAKNFKINDPNANRTNLAQFMDAYPSLIQISY